ncbi:MAG: HEAT repeat domain-containing protein, partial [Candidatus Hydrothermarchaeaceae archaeon]
MGLRDKTEDEIFESVAADNSLAEELEKLLEDSDRDVQKKAIMVVGRMVEENPPLVEGLIPKIAVFLSDSRDDIRHYSVFAVSLLSEVSP